MKMKFEDSLLSPEGEGPSASPDKVARYGNARRSPLTSVCPFILGNELCERLAYYGLCTNLVVYFHEVRTDV